MLEQLFLSLLEISIQASFFIFSVIFIRFCFKRLPKRYVCLLWGLVALRLICPLEITSPFSLVPDTNKVQDLAHTSYVVKEIYASTTNTEITPVYSNKNDVLPPHFDEAEDNYTYTSTESTQSTIDISLLLAILWEIGAVILLFYGLISYLRTKLQLREAVHDTDNIWYCNMPSPFVMGYVKPRIYIPFSVKEEHLPYIIAHEQSHIAHGDHFCKLFGYTILCVYWFNPIIWLGYILYCHDLELACDERVLLKLGTEQKKAYSNALLFCSVSNKALLQSPLSFSEVGVKTRITNILNYRKPGFWGLMAALFACITAIVCFFTSPDSPTDGQITVTDTKEVIAHYTDYTEMLDTLCKDFSALSTDGNIFYACPSGDFSYLTALNEFSNIQLYFYAIEENMNYIIGKSSLSLMRTEEGYDIFEKDNILLDQITTADDYIGYPILYFHSDLLGVIEANRSELGSGEVPLKELLIAYYCNDGRYAELENDFALFAPDTALEMLLPLEGGVTEVLPAEDDLHKLVRYTFSDNTQLTFTMETDGVDSSIGGKAFWFPKNSVYTSSQNALEAKKTEIFTLQATVKDLKSAMEGFLDATDYLHTLPDVFSPDLFCKVAETSDGEVTLYGLRNCNALILQDDNNLYPIFMRWYLNRGILPEVYKNDYDNDGEYEYAIYSLESSGTEHQVMRLTILEVVDGNLVMEIFDNAALSNRMQYSDDTGTKLDCGGFVFFEERDGRWWVRTSVRVMQEGSSISGGTDHVYLEAPLTYYDHHVDENRYFDLGEVSMVELFDVDVISDENENILTTYADQLSAFPGKCSVDKNGNLITSINVRDYECAVTTSSITGETVYFWSPDTYNSSFAKTYPLQIKDGNVQDIPARIVTEKELLEYAFGKALIQMTYKVHPRGIKQYILRENGMIHVNIGYDYNDFLNMQYLGFQISEDMQSVTLTESGLGYYLLQVNNVSALDAFRESYTGKNHMIPSDSTHLPWDWLLALNGEERNIPKITAEDVPVIEHVADFPFYWQNIYDFYNGFVATEIRNDKELLTEYRYKDATDELILYTTNHQDIVSFIYNGTEKTFPSDIESDFSIFDIHSGGGGHHSLPYVMDVTGDGKKEFFLDMGAGGTGVWTNDCIVFDPDTMKQLTFDKNILAITSQLQVTLEEFVPEKNKLHYRLEYLDQNGVSDMGFSEERHPDMLKPGVTLEDAQEYFSYTPDETTHHISYNTEKECFQMEIWIWASNTYFGQYIGDLTADYVWDANADQFVLDLNTVKLDTYGIYD